MKKKIKNKFSIFLWTAGALIIFLSFFGFFLSAQKMPSSIYVSPESLKQGDTIFVRVKSDAGQVSGYFGQQQLNFYKKNGSQDWISFLGVDADQTPGDYKISADTSDAEHLAKEVKVALASFSSAAPAPTPKQTGIATAKAVDNIVKNDNPAIKKFLTGSAQNPYFSGQFSYPLSSMKTSGFGFGKFINFGKFALQHLGVDLRAPEKTQIYAVNDGKVEATLDLSNYGKTVIIDHGMGIFSLYLHLNEFKISAGQMVKKSQLIGLSGDTGYATAPHLHFSIRVGGARVDPVKFIETTQKMNDNFFLADLNQAILNLFK
jgi:murein DD-endopeptidase MepM/ murein hydrolase activator NlpD